MGHMAQQDVRRMPGKGAGRDGGGLSMQGGTACLPLLSKLGTTPGALTALLLSSLIPPMSSPWIVPKLGELMLSLGIQQSVNATLGVSCSLKTR